jgi:hypothetical protein
VIHVTPVYILAISSYRLPSNLVLEHPVFAGCLGNPSGLWAMVI